MHNIKNNPGLGQCYLPQPLVLEDKIDLDLDNSYAQPHPIIV